MKKSFTCVKCEREFCQEANLQNHRKVCLGGGEATEIACDLCGKNYKRKGFKNHRRSCASKRGIVELPTPTPPTPPARVYKRKVKPSPQCGIPMAAMNIRRHINEACKGQRAQPLSEVFGLSRFKVELQSATECIPSRTKNCLRDDNFMHEVLFVQIFGKYLFIAKWPPPICCIYCQKIRSDHNSDVVSGVLH